MSKYDNLSIEDLFERYAIYDEERDAIDEFALGLPDPDRDYFLQLKSRNAVGIGIEPSPFDEIKNVKLFKTNRERGDKTEDFLIYDYNLDRYKAYINSRLALEDESSVLRPYIIETEIKKCQQSLEALQQESLEHSTSKNRFRENVLNQEEIKKCIAYLEHLSSIGCQPQLNNKAAKQETETLSPKPGDSFVKGLHAIAKEHLSHLAGFNKQKKPILSPGDFERLLNYTDDLIKWEKVPENIIPIVNVGVHLSHIRLTFYNISKALYGKKKKYFVDFLHAVFPILFKNEEKTTTYTKFSQGPVSYYQDVIYFGKNGKIGE